ncbi:class I SAM-dependent methyltransferase [Thiohalomonas denitrificans]|uniref:Methyltransferase domain-containing protein n=1 Tax=Thiohalomonas denitrificans TaxID=415747 RepID=A0A1G5QX14_9GAMM|nr:class I SAM-dependent methyltransferase [Thiohalomonas denitrificans]SCZ66292.1 Methyltransferase domain-containing protein [Thiohalomonas denitrificans]
MERVPEPELMDEAEQARAYAEADFEAPHERFVELLNDAFGSEALRGCVLDLGCGPADITIRVARHHPACTLHGVDGAPAMLQLGKAAIARSGLEQRIRLIEGYFPGADLPRRHYDAVISNSLLHHLADPMVLWEAIAVHGQPGAPIFVMDLMRPASREQAQRLVDTYASGEPEVLRHDFYHSLLAAYRPEEIEQQVKTAGLSLQVRAVGDRHLTISGRL